MGQGIGQNEEAEQMQEPDDAVSSSVESATPMSEQMEEMQSLLNEQDEYKQQLNEFDEKIKALDAKIAEANEDDVENYQSEKTDLEIEREWIQDKSTDLAEMIQQKRIQIETLGQPQQAQPQAQDITSQEVAPQEAALQQEVAPQEVMPQEVMPQEAMPQEAMPQEVMPQEVMPQEAMPQEAMPQEAALQEAAPQEAAPQEVAPEPDRMQQIITMGLAAEQGCMEKVRQGDGVSENLNNGAQILVTIHEMIAVANFALARGVNLNSSEEQKEAQKIKADGKPILPQLENAMLKRESRSVSAEAKFGAAGGPGPSGPPAAGAAGPSKDKAQASDGAKKTSFK